jgi:predicted Zn-dependent peptidase
MKMWDPYAEFRTATLPNGLTVRVAHWPGKPWQYVGFVVHSGARHDPVGMEGLQHFVEHLPSMNGIMSYQEMRRFFSDHGGSADFGTTGFPYTKYSFSLPAKNGMLKKALGIFGHMLLLAQLRKGVEHERRVIMSEYGRQHQDAMRLKVQLRQNDAVFGDTFFSRFVHPIGTPQSIASWCISRRDLQECYDRSYVPANMTVVAVGGMGLEELVDLLSGSPFAVHKDGVRTKLAAPMTTVKPPREREYVVNMVETIPEAQSSCINESIACLPGSLNRSAVRITMRMLDEELARVVRETNGWAYSTGTNCEDYGDFARCVIGATGLNVDTLQKFSEVVETTIATLHGKRALFERVRRHMVDSYQMVDMSGDDVFEGAMDGVSHDQNIKTCGAERRELGRVCIDDIREVLHWLRPEQRWTCIVKP